VPLLLVARTESGTPRARSLAWQAEASRPEPACAS
jgi:hypothetical protein